MLLCCLVGVLIGILIMKWINYEPESDNYEGLPSKGEVKKAIEDSFQRTRDMIDSISNDDVSAAKMYDHCKQIQEKREAEYEANYPYRLSGVLNSIKHHAVIAGYCEYETGCLEERMVLDLQERGFDVVEKDSEYKIGEHTIKNKVHIISWCKTEPIIHDFTK